MPICRHLEASRRGAGLACGAATEGSDTAVFMQCDIDIIGERVCRRDRTCPPRRQTPHRPAGSPVHHPHQRPSPAGLRPETLGFGVNVPDQGALITIDKLPLTRWARTDRRLRARNGSWERIGERTSRGGRRPSRSSSRWPQYGVSASGELASQRHFRRVMHARCGNPTHRRRYRGCPAPVSRIHHRKPAMTHFSRGMGYWLTAPSSR
jgi:hypothetical protein